MNNLSLLAERAKARRSSFLIARRIGASASALQLLGSRYIDALEQYHKAKKPGKPFRRPSIGYLTRAL